ncbi:hypothetical protein KOR34_30610 [Posidoniimonas corsicana]|uniref:Double-GTPase 2 domain-containing protein n=1 Tax=Posidoniimonas corsicana TaxID=1938618 RepID=A0A5C5VJC4_9BACT|nr:hypothetical protein [Posidoniimonas corsicana]TWT38093.1 hypothetical protein KOR34_30610 [Posidoniimonas corsicana]
MSQLINVPLESFLLAQRAAPLDCLICGTENSSATERCSRCSAPLAISRAAAGSRRAPQLIAVVGAPGVGKTVYLGMMMDMLVRRVGGISACVCGPYSIGLQQATTTSLASGYYPDRTSLNPEDWHWVHCQVDCSRGRRRTELVLADVSGEAWRQEADRPGTHPALGALLKKCSGMMIIADAQQLHGGDHTGDFIVLKLLSQLEESRRREKRSSRRANRTPLAMVFTKADQRQSCLDDPTGFAEAHAEALLRDCENRFPNTRVFGASVAGASAQRTIGGHRRETPLRIEPQGVVEPLGWLLSQM